MIALTSHAIKRLRQRRGLPKSACLRAAETAYNKGVHYPMSDPTRSIKVYGGFVYVFADTTLITVMHKTQYTQEVGV